VKKVIYVLYNVKVVILCCSWFRNPIYFYNYL